MEHNSLQTIPILVIRVDGSQVPVCNMITTHNGSYKPMVIPDFPIYVPQVAVHIEGQEIRLRMVEPFEMKMLLVQSAASVYPALCNGRVTRSIEGNTNVAPGAPTSTLCKLHM